MRVSNTALQLVSCWDMAKFECRLEQMREVYQTRGSMNSLDEQGTTSPVFSEDPFNDPADCWNPSPLRSGGKQRIYWWGWGTKGGGTKCACPEIFAWPRPFFRSSQLSMKIVRHCIYLQEHSCSQMKLIKNPRISV